MVRLPLALMLGLLLAAGCSDEKTNPTYPEYPPPPIGTWFFAIWGLHADHIFVVGQPGLIYHFDGNQWSREATNLTSVALTDVWGDGQGAVYATGHSGVILRRDPLTNNWSKMASGTSENLFSIGTYQGTIMAGGRKGTLRKLVGQSWVQAPDMIYTRDDNNVVLDTLLVSKDIESLTKVAHHAVGGSAGTLLMPDTAPQGQPVADWQLRTLPAEDWVTGAASDDIDIAGNFVATDDGRLYQLQHGTGNGLVWQERYSPARGATVYGIHVDEDSAVWAVANDGRISRLIPPYQLDDHFSELYNDQSMFFFDIWGSSASNMYAVGVNGLVLRYHEVEVEGEMQMVWEPVELPDLPETKNLPTHLFDKFGRPVHR